MALSEPNTGMACTIDLGTRNNIHPPHKLEVGRRLALLARAGTYGEQVVSSGPTYSHLTIDGSKVRVHFEHVAGGLAPIAPGRAGEPLAGFEIATADGEFLPGLAHIDGDCVVVQHPDIAAPEHVRYAWLGWPSYSLCNAEGLPAPPFRTDTRKGVTADAR
jgi:sialate O-acetylesterase